MAWEETGSVTKACTKAHVSRQTFYNWKPRFEDGGYEALNECRSHAPQNPNRIAVEVEAEVIEMRRDHPNGGKRRIADEVAKGNSWVPVVSANTVKRILKDVGLWSPEESRKKKRLISGQDSGGTRSNHQY